MASTRVVRTTPEEWAARSEQHAAELARVRSLPLPPGRGGNDRMGNYDVWGLAPDGWGAIGPPDAPYGWNKNGAPCTLRPGRPPGVPNRSSRMEQAIADAIKSAVPRALAEAEIPGTQSELTPTMKMKTQPGHAIVRPEPAETIFVADENEVAAIADDPERIKRTHQIEYVRAWQVVRAAMQSKFLGLKDRATIAMDVIKTMRAGKEIFVIDPTSAAEVDWAKEVLSIQRGLAKYAPTRAGNADDATRSNN